MTLTQLLYVDDEAYTAELIRTALETQPIRLQWAQSGEEGIEAMQHARYDIVVTDYRLPGRSGLDVVAAARSAGVNVPVIMLSGSGDISVVVKAIQLGAADYLIKDPQNTYLDVLPTAIERVLQVERLIRDNSIMEARLAAERSWSRMAIDRIQQGLCLFDEKHQLQLWNRRFQEYYGYPEELCQRGTTYETLLRYKALRGDYGIDGERQIQASLSESRNEQSARWEEKTQNLVLEVFRDPLPTAGFVITFTDITERWHSEQRVRHEASHDALTELPNRVLFRQLLQHELAIAREVPSGLAVLFIDLDGFKAVNDNYGHATGDAVLIETARRLRSQVRAADVVGRQSGDEFLALLVGAREEQACQIADALIVALQAPFHFSGVDISVGASIGVAQFPTAGVDEDALLKAADDAMYRAKMSSKGQHCVARPIS